MAMLLALPFIPRASYPTLVPHSVSGISASARRCLRLEQKSTAHIPTSNTLLVKPMESLAQRITALTFELRLHFGEAIRVRVGSYSWKCAVWMNREISVLLRSERVCG